jgi:O-antigen/teichoic acid export membrane protein
LAGLEIASLILSFVLAILSVHNGFGVFALVVQRLSEKIFLCAGYVYLSPWKFSWEFDFLLVKKWVHSFGFATLCSGLLSIFLYDFMGAFIGIASGARQGGLYARSFKMATLPLIFTTVCNRLTTPLYAKYVGDIQNLKKTFLLAQFVKLCVVIPVQCVLAFSAPVWMFWVLGEQWQGAVILYQILCLYGGLRAFYDDVPVLFLYGLRKPWIMFQQHVVQGMALFCASVVLSKFFTGALCGAVVVSVGMAVGVLVLWVRTLKVLGISAADCIQTVQAMSRYVRVLGHRLVGKSYDQT